MSFSYRLRSQKQISFSLESMLSLYNKSERAILAKQEAIFPFAIKKYISESTWIKALDLLTSAIDRSCPWLPYFDSAGS